MNHEFIGSNAGLICNVLTAANDQTVKSLKKATTLKDKELYCALGWLSIEGKVSFYESGEEMVIGLVCLFSYFI